MKELGFNKEAPTATQEAFIKHLIKASTGQNVMTPTEKKIIQDNPDKIVQFPKQLPQQMTFDFSDDDQKENIS